MKKVFLLAALVLACTAGSNASAMNEAALNASMSEMMPVKKTAKKTTKKTSKKTTTKKTSTKKTTSATSSTTAATTTTSATTTSATTSNAVASTSATSNAGSAVAGILGAVLGGNSNSSSSAGSSIINGILNNVIGSGTFSKQDLCAHTWKYSKPGCAFTSENLLAQAGGEIAANKVEEKLSEYYSKFGFSSSNTYFTFKTDGTFAAKIDGKSWYTFDEKTHAIQMKGLILSMSGYATKTANGISLLFDQKKLLNLIKTIGSLKGNSTLSALGTIANNYDGMRVGFEMTK